MPQAVAVDPPRRRTRLTQPLHPVGRVDGHERADDARDARPVRPRRPVARYGALSGRYRSGRARSPSTERRGRAFLHREPSLRATVRRDGETRVPRRYGAVKPRRAAPPRRDTLVLAHVRCESSVDLTKLSQPPVNFACFLDYDRTYGNYMKLATFGNLRNFA